MRRRFLTLLSPVSGLLLLALALPNLACEGYEPTPFPVGDTAVLYSLARAEYIGERSGFDFATPQAVIVERAKQGVPADFDVAFSEIEGEFVMLPAGLFEGMGVDPGIAVDSSGALFERLDRAPSQGYVTDEAVPLRLDRVYFVRTRNQNGCRRYAKFEVLDLDPAGILEFRFLRNNLCNDRGLPDVDTDED
ncbi:MAG: hypothetical protein ACOC3J_02955 [Gemmatimonadota bacterium]